MITLEENLPQELKDLPQWVGVMSGDKVPLDLKTGECASSSESSTWADYKTASENANDSDVDYLGFVFNGNGITAIDIDTGTTAEGFLSEEAMDIIFTCGSYTEESRSGRGFHILVRGTLPFKGRNNQHGIEMYHTGRYFIMTGRVRGFSEIIENQQAIDYIVNKYFPETRENNGGKYGPKIYTPVFERPVNGRIKIRPKYPPIPDGCRNTSLASLAGAMHTTGYGKKEIYQELIYCNQQACKPPLSASEVESIANSIGRYSR